MQAKEGSVFQGFCFRAGYDWHFSDKDTALQVFSEIFINEIYRLSPSNKRKTIVDVGSNIGLFALYAHMKMPNAHVYSVEASPTTFKTLERNVLFNNLGNCVSTFNLAISDRSGRRVFYEANTSGWSSLFNSRGASNSIPVKVNASTFSAVCTVNEIREIDYLKMDIEGAEYDAILGDTRFFRVPIHEAVIEVDRTSRSSQHTVKDLLDLLAVHFRTVRVRGGGDNEYPILHCLGTQ